MSIFSKAYIKMEIWEPLKEILRYYYEDIGKKLLVALLILIATFIVAKIVQVLLKLILRLLKFDDFSDKIGLTKFLESGGLYNIPSTTIANLIYWIILFIGFTVSVDRLLERSAYQIVGKLIFYIPDALTGIFIFIVGSAIGVFLAKFLRILVLKMGIREKIAKFIEVFLLALIVIFSLLLALEQVRLSQKVVGIIIDNALTYTFLGLALAFGIGGRFFAGDIVAGLKLRRLYPRGSEIYYDNVKGILKKIGLFDSLVYTEEGIVNIPNSLLARKIIMRKYKEEQK